MANNSINDKWLIVYQGTLDNYKRDSNKDSYKNKMVLVTGDKAASGERDQTSYLCIDDDTHSVNIPIPAIYLRGIGIGKNTYGFPDSILKFASANGINVSFSGGAVTIGIDNDTLDKINSIDNKVEQTEYDDKVAELETSIADNKDYIDKEVVRLEGYAEEMANAAETVAKTYTDGKIEAVEEAIGGKYTKPAGGIPVKDLVDEVATKTEVVNAISKVATDLNDKIGSKVGKDDLKNLTYKVNGVSTTYNGLSEATMQIFTPTEVGKQGQLLQSMGGGAPQWTNLSEVKEAIGFAKDLTGVLEATPEEFTFRPSAGNKSIRDEGAVIRRIKGNTTVWGQLADITKISNTGAKYIMETGDGWFSIQRDLSNPNTPYCRVDIDEQYNIPSHIYLFSQEIEVSGIVTSDDYCSAAIYNFDTSMGPNIKDYRQDGKYLYTRIRKKSDSATFNFFYYAYGNAKLRASNLQCFDLTSIFGAGNEPQTYEEFKAIYPDIYPYCEPEIRNVKTTAIETVGFNQWDEEWEIGIINSSGNLAGNTTNIRSSNFIPVIGGATYYSRGGDCIIACYDENKKFIPYNGETGAPVYYNSINVHNSTFVLPINTRYIKFWMAKTYGSIYNNDICINLSHTGVRNGEYEPYKKNTLLLPEIANYFPDDGMNGIINVTSDGRSDIYDEINSDNAIQRIGVVDLGTLTWEEYSDDSTNTVYVARDLQGATGKRTGKTAKYSNTTTAIADMPDKTMLTCTDYPTYIYICDNDYSSVEEFTSAMQGVYIYYELAEPIVTPILEPIQLVYDVEDFGTERAISTEDSAPFRADIVYQFNAEGRIRDNGRNIEKLENKIRSYHDDGVMATIDREIITTKSIIGNSEFRYALPDAPQDVKGDADGTLATEFWVQQNIPTEIATATQKNTLTDPPRLNAYSANIVYEFLVSKTELTIDALTYLNEGYDNVWIIRFGCEEGLQLTIKPTVFWKDGVAPTFGAWGICELKFYKNSLGYLGEWKIYR